MFGVTDKTGMASLFLVIPPSPYPVRIRIDLESPSFPQICPLAPKKEDRSVTLRECYESYVSLRTLRPSTRSGYDRVVMKYCADWLDRDLSSITDDEIIKKYLSIRDISGQGQAALAMRVIKALNSYANAKFHIESCGTILLSETPDAKGRCPVVIEPHQNEVVLPDENLALRAKIDAADSDCAPEKSFRKNLVHQGEYAAMIPLGASPVRRDRAVRYPFSALKV